MLCPPAGGDLNGAFDMSLAFDPEIKFLFAGSRIGPTVG